MSRYALYINGWVVRTDLGKEHAVTCFGYCVYAWEGWEERQKNAFAFINALNRKEAWLAAKGVQS